MKIRMFLTGGRAYKPAELVWSDFLLSLTEFVTNFFNTVDRVFIVEPDSHFSKGVLIR